ncbi:succinate dehydrogenase assembly factor 2, mitochondrial-like [Agrilus planipennis]|uniref:Succinate dehydrogenase assembly factor 2, mitochondrial n=1 Tax=Agrilus planipennis TaxID=224129 RepID=A0A1W4WPU0_AGRPL|nr:succinate dehydrogenase assembly factor 2, mitochondrial-like [Agrilus planipennis]XP_018322487.1 succinate dehydrogenase assembly factor 2, mitochondrial-like [Agrilus planipennis]XP_018322488.1 succinate dehydrogenase assembly factor 2, mitochondrial-like [Agrilus planipennis]
MNKLVLLNILKLRGGHARHITSCSQLRTNETTQPPFPVPEFTPPKNETLKNKKARLVYQSRKRGMLENGLLLSTFIHKYLDTMTENQLDLYDSLINKPSNDWDLYYWAVGVQPTPPEFDNEIMDLFKKHVQNLSKEPRIRQPDLY